MDISETGSTISTFSVLKGILTLCTVKAAIVIYYIVNLQCTAVLFNMSKKDRISQVDLFICS